MSQTVHMAMGAHPAVKSESHAFGNRSRGGKKKQKKERRVKDACAVA